jgi:hypothetical protein
MVFSDTDYILISFSGYVSFSEIYGKQLPFTVYYHSICDSVNKKEAGLHARSPASFFTSGVNVF